MKALVFDGPERLQIREWQAPRCGPGDVLLRPLATGICAGDQYIYAGRNPYATYPIIGGHEICGEVVEVGSDVTNVTTGSVVVIEPVVGCGHCHPCRHGKPNCCSNFSLIGLHHPGGFAERVVAPFRNVHRVPSGLDAVTASFAEPLTIGLHACHRGSIGGGEFVFLLGAGPIGLAVMEVAKLRGARVVVADVNADRLAFAAQLGAETLDAGRDVIGTVLEMTHGEGADVVIEATGVASVIESTIDLVAAGGRIVILGLVKKGAPVSLPGLDLTRKEVNILGSRNSVNCFPEALALLASGAIHFPRVAAKFPLDEGPDVFRRLHASPGAYHKAVLILSDPVTS